MVLGIIAFIVTLGVIVLVHEIGHFVAAKRARARVDEFGLGFPPRITTLFTRGGTRYTLNWVPLGGFVKIKGESGDAKEASDSFAHKSFFQRGTILAAGVGMNFLLAAILFSMTYLIGAPSSLEGLGEGAEVRDRRLQIIQVVPDSPAATAGIEPGDIIRKVDGQPTLTVKELQQHNSTGVGRAIPYTIERDGMEQSLTVTPTAELEGVEVGKEVAGIVGVQPIETGIVTYSLPFALWNGALATLRLTWQTLMAFATILGNLFTGQGVGADLAGPIGIAVLTTQVTQLGISYLLQFAALLSINIAIINFLPFPALDGGRFLFLVIEKIRGRTLPERTEALVHNIGFALLILLVVVVTFQDLSRFSGDIFSFFQSLTGS